MMLPSRLVGCGSAALSRIRHFGSYQNFGTYSAQKWANGASLSRKRHIPEPALSSRAMIVFWIIEVPS
jgi:hypothetical protein